MSTVCQGDEFLRQMATRPPFSKLHPQMAAFLAGYLAEEKVTRFGDRWVLNTHFPPYPGPAFDNLARHFGQTDRPALHSVLLRQVSFDFPRDADQVRAELEEAGFRVERLWQGEIAFPCADAAAALEHLLKSGAGTAFHDAVDPARRDRLMAEFRRLLDARHADGRPFAVVHEYLAAVATSV